MARSSNQPWPVRHAPLIVSLGLLALGLIPLRYVAWVEWFASPAAALFAPISQPLKELSRWLAPATRESKPEDLARLEDENERTRQQLFRAQEENRRLRDRVAALESGAAIAPAAPVDQIARRVIAEASDPGSTELRIRAGAGDGITPNVVATVRGVQLLGRVVRVQGPTCVVRPITDKAAGAVRGAIVVDEAASITIACELRPTGLGTLRGDAEFVDPRPGLPPPPDPRVGMSVRLSDDEWPIAAQGLLLGVVESVQADERQPLRKVVTVRPTLDLRRASEVVLRIPRDADDASPAPAPQPRRRPTP